jgi:hypothetical protein
MSLDSWPIQTAGNFDELFALIRSREKKAAWRGHSDSKWKLESSLDRFLRDRKVTSYEESLKFEEDIKKEFITHCVPYSDLIEKEYLRDGIWGSVALGQHSGLPTRLLDWTRSAWIAAWFACHETQEADGMIWWFDFKAFERNVGRHWNRHGVPYRNRDPKYDGWAEEKRVNHGIAERDIEYEAFTTTGKRWISKLHFQVFFPRMEAQQGFHTVCGRLHLSQDDAIDEMAAHPLSTEIIPRGRIRIVKSAKRQILDDLYLMNIHAKSLLYPGIDLAARAIRDQFKIVDPPPQSAVKSLESSEL